MRIGMTDIHVYIILYYDSFAISHMPNSHARVTLKTMCTIPPVTTCISAADCLVVIKVEDESCR